MFLLRGNLSLLVLSVKVTLAMTENKTSIRIYQVRTCPTDANLIPCSRYKSEVLTTVGNATSISDSKQNNVKDKLKYMKGTDFVADSVT